MKNRNILYLSLLLSILFSVNVFATKTKKSVGAFTKLNVSSAIDVYFTQSEKYSLEIESDDNVDIEFYVTEGTLVLKRKSENTSFWKRNKQVKAYLSAPSLESIILSGSSDFYSKEIKGNHSFTIRASGSSDVQVGKLNFNSCNFVFTGSSDFVCDDISCKEKLSMNSSGSSDSKIYAISVGEYNLNLSGSSDYNIQELKAKNLIINQSGSSDSKMNIDVSFNTDVSISGGSDIRLTGKTNSLKLVCSGGADANIRNLSYKTINSNKSSGASIID